MREEREKDTLALSFEMKKTIEICWLFIRSIFCIVLCRTENKSDHCFFFISMRETNQSTTLLIFLSISIINDLTICAVSIYLNLLFFTSLSSESKNDEDNQIEMYHIYYYYHRVKLKSDASICAYKSRSSSFLLLFFVRR